jgi:3-oxoacyl-[acyl-carrier-protein] synthase II
MGAVTPVGNTVPEFWQALQKGACGIAPIKAYDTGDMAAKLAGEVHIDIAAHLKPAEARKMDRFTQLAIIAAREALAASGITAPNSDLDRAEVIVSSGIGGLATTEREYDRGKTRGFDRVSPFYIPTTIANIAAGRIAIEAGFKGDCSCIVTACASSTHAVGEAARHIRHGYADVALAGGAEAVVIPLAMGGFTSMLALYTGSDVSSASIPFDARRSGFVLGEGAGMLVLEEYDHALARGATIYAELAGFAATCDAYHITAPCPTGEGAIRSMRAAIADAGLEPGDIGYINAHGTSTPLNDKSEAAAIHAVFGEERAATPPVSSTKSSTGHLLGAVGAVEAIVCALALHDGYLPPTVNYRDPDPECDLDIITGLGRHTPVRAALSNSLGFGGHNATLVLTKG